MTIRPEHDFRGDVAIGSNPERNRAHNRRVVLDAVRLHGHLGRTAIARHAHLTPQAVANIVDELVAENLLIELGRLRSGRGQPPMQFAVNPDGPMTVGVEIAADRMVTVLLDLAGRVRAQSIRAVRDTDPEHVLPQLADSVAAIRTALPGVPAALLGIGVVMPGPFEVDGMSSVGPATLPGWSGLDARALLAQATGEAVEFENDATAAAVAERLYGAGSQCSNFCLVYFGVGLGLGIIHEGRPMRGGFGNAGEIGHLAIVPRGRPASGSEGGTLERFASLHALRQKLAAAGRRAERVEDLEALFGAGDPIIMAWIAEAAAYLATTVATLENLLDPETIIFGGALPDAVIDAIIAALEPLPVSVATRRERLRPRVMRGQSGQLTAALGAAALPLLQTITPRLHRAPGRAPAPSLDPTS